MKERLDQLTLQQLIDLSCGDCSVLTDGQEEPTEDELSQCAMNILYEYKSIASPSQAKLDMIDGEKLSKLRIKEKCARIGLMLCKSGHPDKAREVLIEMGIDAAYLQTDELILARCQSIVGEVEYESKRMEEYASKRAGKAQSTDQVRKSWYSEIAGVMGVFHMNIDPLHTNAAVYAHLVYQAVERSKAMAKMPTAGGMLM